MALTRSQFDKLILMATQALLPQLLVGQSIPPHQARQLLLQLQRVELALRQQLLSLVKSAQHLNAKLILELMPPAHHLRPSLA